MNTIKNKTYDEERALYGSQGEIIRGDEKSFGEVIVQTKYHCT